MELALWEMFAIFFAGAFVTLLSGLAVGILVYKTRYAGDKLFVKESEPKGEAFNADEDFIDDEVETTLYPEEIEEANERFVEQFNAEQMIRELANIEKMEKEAEDQADRMEALEDAT